MLERGLARSIHVPVCLNGAVYAHLLSGGETIELHVFGDGSRVDQCVSCTGGVVKCRKTDVVIRARVYVVQSIGSGKETQSAGTPADDVDKNSGAGT